MLYNLNAILPTKHKGKNEKYLLYRVSHET